MIPLTLIFMGAAALALLYRTAELTTLENAFMTALALALGAVFGVLLAIHKIGRD